ncbi:MAG: TIGR02099 family protein, partial [Nitrosomonadales bacterium]|nr:TIGR02099 family protein [Nitrosomonadales bacterium]
MIIVLTLSILTLRYFILPNIENYKDRIAEQITQVAGQKITIGHIEASWHGMNPHLSLRQVAIYDDQNRMALTLHEIETSLSWLSIPLFEPKLSSLLIQGPALSIRREADGTLVVAGIRMGGESKPELANWVLRQSRIDIVDATILWQDDLRKAPALTLNDLQLTIENPVWERLLNRHRFALKATPSAGSSHPIDLRGNLYGSDIANTKEWRGTLYGRMDGTDISAWRKWVDYPFDLSEGHGAARFWLDFADGEAKRLTSDVILQKVRGRISKNTAEAKLTNLAGRLIWSRHEDGQSLNLERVKLATADGLMLENGSLGVRERQIAGQEDT